ncbi:MAG TPA: ribose-phosphate pyrophosphokinase [Candidatus Paceibacterota bacterium]|nr:ribose-phosphate pyrophosphokinase [Candidatus Paceibacterota bacterium]
MEKILFAGSSNFDKMAEKIAKASHIHFGNILIQKFACGEKYIQLLDDVKGKIVYIYQTANENPDEIIMETLLMANAAKENGAKKIVLISPLLLYSRQDKKTTKDKREPISAKLLARLYETAGIDKIITCHLHSDLILKFYKIPILNLKVYHLFAKELKKIIKKQRDWQVVSPDEGARKDGQKFAQILGGLETAFFKKERESPDKKINMVSSLNFYGNIKGKNVILFDDMVDTGGTIIKAKEKLILMGAKKIILAAVHPVLSGNAKEKLEKANFFKIFFSNSVPINDCSNKLMKNLEIIDLTSEIKKHL